MSQLQAPLLENDADAQFLGGLFIGNLQISQSSEIDRSGSRLMNARQEIHQGAFPGAVFADYRVDFSGLHGKIHALQYLDAVWSAKLLTTHCE